MTVNQVDSKYVDINVNLAKKSSAKIKMEKGCIFETKVAKFKIDDNGNIGVFDKKTQTWHNSESISLTNYQMETLKAVANNNNEGFNEITLSKKDIFSAIEKFKKGEFKKDLSEFLSGYKVQMAKLFSKDNAVSAYITNGNKYQSSEMKFQVADETSKKALSSSYIDYQKPITIRVSYDKVSAATISATYGIDPYRLVKANPQINWKVSFNKDNMAILSPATLPKGTKLNIPERYTIKAGSVKNFSDVAKVTGISENYIKDILMGIEGRHGKPDLKAYYDGVGSGKGTLTIGFGHCGRVNGKPLTSKTRITEAQAYELLAQDILDAKINAIDYLGKSNFENAPKSIQTAIIDIAFNKGIYSGFELPNSKTKELKKNLAQKDYVHAAANTVRKTGSKGLKKRNIYRAIMATGNLTKAERARALALIKPEYEATVKLFSGVDKKLLEKAWQNAHRGITSGFFSK